MELKRIFLRKTDKIMQNYAGLKPRPSTREQEGHFNLWVKKSFA